MKAQATDKPPYRVPSMPEIAAIRGSNGYKVVSTFSGCGGSCLGFEMEGFDIRWANEFIAEARTTYAANHPATILDGRDIRSVTAEEILLATGIAIGELDVLEGSPPCASFSTAGNREKDWGRVKSYSDRAQRTDDLFFEFIRLLRGLKPKVFVAENVSGLIKGTAKGYFLEILRELKASGYRVEARLLDAQWLGVPQARQRIIFMGVRDDIGLDPAFPKPLPYRYSVRDALPWIMTTEGRVQIGASGGFGNETWKGVDNPCCTIGTGPSSGNGRAGSGDIRIIRKPLPPGNETDISKFAIGAEWDKLKPGQASKKYFNLVKADANQPSPSICASHGNLSTAGVTHPTERRKFTIAELKRICAFPDDFELTGSYAQQWERLGRSVPPLMMARVAACVRGILDKCQA